jgi:hypothetical protein
MSHQPKMHHTLANGLSLSCFELACRTAWHRTDAVDVHATGLMAACGTRSSDRYVATKSMKGATAIGREEPIALAGRSRSVPRLAHR